MDLQLFAIVVYIVEGFTIVPLNFLLSLSILFNKSLRQRKEFVFIVGLAISDAIYGIGCIEYGRDKLMNSYLSNNSLLSTTPFRCFLTPNALIIMYSYQASMLIMCSISVERLIAVVSFHVYGRISHRSHVFVLICAYCIPFVAIFSYGYESYLLNASGAVLSNGCTSFSVVEGHILPTAMLTLGASNVILYGVVLVAYKTRMPPATSFNSQQTMRDRRLTQTVALITGCMLIFYCVPLIIARILTSYSVFSVHLYLYLSMPLQYIAHVLVVYWRQKEIRQGVKEFLCGNSRTSVTAVSSKFPINNSVAALGIVDNR